MTPIQIKEAQILYAALFTSNWRIAKVPVMPWDSDEAKAENANKWTVERLAPPFCCNNGPDKALRIWTGEGVEAAIRRAVESLGSEGFVLEPEIQAVLDQSAPSTSEGVGAQFAMKLRSAMMPMTAVQKVKWLIVAKHAAWHKLPMPEYPLADVDAQYEALVATGEYGDEVNEVRCCADEETQVEHPFHRHYEGTAVGERMPDGSWVGWTYWHGGGHHGRPEDVEWVELAYDLECVEEEKLQIVRTFKKREPQST